MMLRVLLTAVFAMAMLVNPVFASSARVECEHGMSAMDMPMSMDSLATIDGMDIATAPAADPCCDHDKMPPDCAKVCAMLHAMTAALPPVPPSMAIFVEREVVLLMPTPLLSPFDPSGFERPPKLLV